MILPLVGNITGSCMSVIINGSVKKGKAKLNSEEMPNEKHSTG